MEFLKNHCSENKNVFIILVIVLIAFLFILSVSGIVGILNQIKEGKYIGQEIETKNTITVSDTGEVYTKPDLGITSFSVKTETTLPILFPIFTVSPISKIKLLVICLYYNFCCLKKYLI